MRKNDLIKKLQEIEGNPEIVLWNGMVGDFMHIDGDIKENYLVRMTKEYLLETCRREKCIEGHNWELTLNDVEIKETIAAWKKHHKWKMNQFVTQEDIDAKRYSLKKVFVIDAKQRGVKTFDRLGGIEY